MTMRGQAQEDWERNVFAGLEELGARGGSFEPWAWRVEPQEHTLAPPARFDLRDLEAASPELGPPPRLA